MNSSQPDEQLIHAYVNRDPRAIAIVESWKPNFPITLMKPQELEELSQRCRTTFTFKRTGDNPLPSYADPDLPTMRMKASYTEDEIVDENDNP